MLRMVRLFGVLAALGLSWPTPAAADPVQCDDPSCVPGINRVVALGAYCDNPTYHVFATTNWGRVVFCESARGLPPRYFRSPALVGIRQYNTPCLSAYTQVAQAPDGLFLMCAVVPNSDRSGDGSLVWARGDHYVDPNSPW